jgi:hypothetical protein
MYVCMHCKGMQALKSKLVFNMLHDVEMYVATIPGLVFRAS